MEQLYLIRYGLWHQMGLFASDTVELERGQTVVIRSNRGTELGDVLTRIDSATESSSSSATPRTTRVLRVANSDDLEHVRKLEIERPVRFDLCQQVFQERYDQLELIDVESLLDDRRIVIHYLGPHDLDDAELCAALREACGIDALLEPVGRATSGDHETPDPGSKSCDRCAGGTGCHTAPGGCSSSPDRSHGGCSDCGVKRILAARNPVAVR